MNIIFKFKKKYLFILGVLLIFPNSLVRAAGEGFIHYDGEREVYLYDDGSVFIPNGFCADDSWRRPDDGPIYRGTAWYNTNLKEHRLDTTTLTYDEWFRNLKAAGINNIRVRIGEGSGRPYSGGDGNQGLAGFEPPPYGTYNVMQQYLNPDNLAEYRSLQVAWDDETFGAGDSRYEESNITQLIRAAEKFGVHIKVCLFGFNEADDDGHRWVYSAYNNDCNYVNKSSCEPKDRGFLSSVLEFYTDPIARMWQKRRIDFIMEKWGNSPAIWMWEIMNEYQYALSHEYDDELKAWVEDIAQHIRSHEQSHGRNRPVTVSSYWMYGKEAATDFSTLRHKRNQIFNSPYIDTVELHNYGAFSLKLRQKLVRDLQEMFPGKPIMVGEFWPWRQNGDDLGESGPLIDKTLHFNIPRNEEPPHKNSIGYTWLQMIASGGAGGAMRWDGLEEINKNYWERGSYADPDMLSIYTPVSKFIDYVDWNNWGIDSTGNVVGHGSYDDQVDVHNSGLGSDDFVQIAEGDGDQLLLMFRSLAPGSTQITVRGLDQADYTVTLFDWQTGDILQRQVGLVLAEGVLDLSIDVSEIHKNIGIVYVEGKSLAIPGDLDGDGDVDIFDLVIVGNCFGLEAAGDCERADANNSGGTIDIFDLVMVGSHFGEIEILKKEKVDKI